MLKKQPKGATKKRRGGSIASILWMLVGAALTLMVGLFVYLWNPFDMNSTAQTPQRTVEPINQTDGTDDVEYEFYDLLPEQEMVGIPDSSILDDSDFAELAKLDDNTAPDTLTPDVVVDASRTNSQPSPSPSDSNTNNFGISEQTILNPLGNQTANTADDTADTSQVAIVQDDDTYDEPDSATTNEVAQIRPAATNNTYILQINSFGDASEADKRRAQVLMAGVDAKVVQTQSANGQTYYQVITPPSNNRQKIVIAQQRLQNNGIDSLIVEQRRQ